MYWENVLARFSLLLLCSMIINAQPSRRWDQDKEPCECGRLDDIQIYRRIVMGQNVSQGKYPWHAALYNNSEGYFCGGTLISRKYVVTAAHCVTGRDKSSFMVILGSHFRNQTDVNEKEFFVSSFHIHPNYTGSHDNDIALIKLRGKAKTKIEGDFEPICLPFFQQEPMEGDLMMAVGWGDLSYGGLSPITLKDVTLPYISTVSCRSTQYPYRNEITDNMICAGGQGKDTCQGDSGGPLLKKVDGRYFLYGVTSFGIDCGKYPGVYVKVINYLQWINEVRRTNAQLCMIN